MVIFTRLVEWVSGREVDEASEGWMMRADYESGSEVDEGKKMGGRNIGRETGYRLPD